MMKSSDRQAAAELLVALVEVAVAHGRRHYSESGEPLATTLGAPFSVVIPTLRNGEHRRLAFDPVHEPMLARDAARPVALQGVP